MWLCYASNTSWARHSGHLPHKLWVWKILVNYSNSNCIPSYFPQILAKFTKISLIYEANIIFIKVNRSLSNIALIITKKMTTPYTHTTTVLCCIKNTISFSKYLKSIERKHQRSFEKLCFKHLYIDKDWTKYVYILDCHAEVRYSILRDISTNIYKCLNIL